MMAGFRLHPEHARFADTLHQLGAVLIPDVPGLVPFNEALWRRAWVFAEDLLPFLARLLLATELAQDREIVNIGVKRFLVGVLSDQLERALVVSECSSDNLRSSGPQHRAGP